MPVSSLQHRPESSPYRHSSEGWNPVIYIIHSRKAGMTTEALFRQAGRSRNRPNIPASLPSAACSRRRSTTASMQAWIPACAGMTVGIEDRYLPNIAKGLSGWRQTHSDPRRHSSEGWNPVVYISHSRKAGMTTEVLASRLGETAIRLTSRLRPPRFRPSPE